jgi:hypothetical protein
MKYMVRNLIPNAAGIYTAPSGWKVSSVLRQFTDGSPEAKLLLSVLLEELPKEKS